VTAAKHSAWADYAAVLLSAAAAFFEARLRVKCKAAAEEEEAEAQH
jgi:hypothetical protein